MAPEAPHSYATATSTIHLHISTELRNRACANPDRTYRSTQSAPVDSHAANQKRVAHVAAAGFLSHYLSGPLPYV